jgi:hypothetical protein
MAKPFHEVKYRVQSAISYVAAHNENVTFSSTFQHDGWMDGWMDG